MPRARHLGQDTLQPRLFIAPTQPPNRGRITLQLKGHGLNACAFGDGQHHPCSLDLKPRQSATACNLFEDRLIVSGQQKTTWFSTSHEQPPRLLALSPSLIVATPNFLQNLWPGTLEALVKKGRSAVRKRLHAEILLKADEGEHGPAWKEALANPPFEPHRLAYASRLSPL